MLFLLASFASATEPVSSAAEPAPSTAEPVSNVTKKVRYPRAKVTRGAGQILTVMGAVIAVPSSMLLTSGLAAPCTYECLGKVFAIIGGGAGLVLSTPFLGTGIPLWVVGQKRHRANLKTRMVLVPQLSTDRVGLRVSGRF